MCTVADIVNAPGLEALHVVAGDPPACDLRGVDLVESVSDLATLPVAGLAVIPRTVSRSMPGYQLDIATREAAERGLAGVVLHGRDVDEIPTTTRRIADRFGCCLLVAAPPIGEGDLVIRIWRVLAGGAEAALARAAAASRAVEAAEREGAGPRVLCAAASRAIGLPIEQRTPQQGDLAAGLTVDGRPEGFLAAPDPGGAASEAVRLVLRITAGAVSAALSARAWSKDAPTRSRTLLLGRLLGSSRRVAIELAGQARDLGLPIDGWHLVVRVDLGAEERDELGRLDLMETIGLTALDTARRMDSPDWHLAYDDQAPLLVRMWRRDPDRCAATSTTKAVEEILARLRERFPHLRLRCGVGGVREGVEGLRVSAAEARAALATSLAGGRAVVSFDQGGLHRMVVEWCASDSARDAVRELLAPLDRLGPERAATAVRTLRAYLDHQGSVKAAAAALNLHRNAVAYRIKKILAQLDVDIDDPDQRLALQLSCRAWLLR